MKRITVLFLIILLFTGCSAKGEPAQVAATTLPVYEFTSRLCQGTGINVTRLVTEEVSCLHDYSLNVRQVKAAEAAEVIVISGAGLEEFMEDLLHDRQTIDASHGIELICPEEADPHDHSHEEDTHGEADHEEHDHGEADHEEHDHDHGHEGHHHDQDPHIWLSPVHAMTMVENICTGLSEKYPEYAEAFSSNKEALLSRLEDLLNYGQEQLSSLSCRELITFHDGFAYFAQCFDLHILEAVEEESGSEASARELIHLIEEVEHHSLPAIFTEKSGSVSAAGIIARETGCGSFVLDMAMAGDSYFDAMYHNIDTVKEAME